MNRHFSGLFLVAVIFLSLPSRAQLVSSYYTWSQSSQTFVSGISTTSTTPADIFPQAWDDNSNGTAFTFPFNFNYKGTTYSAGTSAIGIDADGWIAFSTGAITMTGSGAGGSWFSITDHTGVYLNGNANNDGFCGFNSDIYEQIYPAVSGNLTAGSPVITSVSDLSNLRVGVRLSGTGIINGTIVIALNSTNGSVTMSSNATTTGTAVSVIPRSSIYGFLRGIAPYRQFVVQYTRTTRYNAAGDDFSFQLVLNEGGGDPVYQTLQVVYGICKAANNAVPQNAQVGLRGASNSDFNARKTSTNWSATVPATLNTDVCTLTPAVDPRSGLTYTWSPACLTSPSNAGAISGPVNVCPNTIIDYAIPGVPGAIYYAWTYSGTGTTISDTTTLPLNTFTFGPAATGGTITVTPLNLCGGGASASLVISVSGAPTAAISYSPSSLCTSAIPVSVTQTGTGGGTYSASPGGLTINTSTGQVTPSSSTPGTYVVTYTFTSGCTATTTANINISAGPTVTVTASPSIMCAGNNSQLSAVPGGGTYAVSSISYTSLTPSGSPTNIYNVYTDEAISPAFPIPWTFNYYGQSITQFVASPNGYIQLGGAGLNSLTPQTLPNPTTPNNVIALAWCDLVVDPAVNAGSNMRYFVNGVTPNRIMVIDFVKLTFYSFPNVGTMTGQIRLYENDNHIEVAAGTVNDAGLLKKKTLGIEDLPGTAGLAPAGRNNVVWNLASPEAWSFYPTIFTYLWSPSTFLSSNTISNPVATGVTSTTTYNVQVTNTSTGCSVNSPVTVTVGSPLNGLYRVGIGGDFTTLTAAVNTYNGLCITGPVIFSLIDNTYPSETYPIIINSNSYASATNTLTIKPAATKIPLFSGSSATSLLQLNGADYVTIDGSNTVGGTTRNLSLTNTAASSNAVLWITSASTSNGATNNTIKYCNIFGANSSGTIACVLTGGGVTAGTDAEFPNNNNTIQNNLLYRAQNGVYQRGKTGSNDLNWLITENNIGSVTAADKMGFRGIGIVNSQNFNITKNVINGVLSTSTSTMTGIGFFLGINTGTVSNNNISDIKNTNTTGYGCNGIYLGSNTTAANLNVVNNFIFDIAAKGYILRSPSDNGYGIVADLGGGYNIYYNTVHLNTSQTSAGYPASILITSGVTTAGSINLKNNIFINNQTTATERYAIESTASNTVFGTINYNDYFSAGPNTGYVGGTNRNGIAAIQTGFGQNANSIVVSPTFVSATDMHLQSIAANSIISNLGSPIATVLDDYDVTTRNGLTPDMGADEFLMPNSGSWVGRTSIDWTTDTNWETNFIPDAVTDVTVTGGYSNLPTLTTVQPVRNLVMSGGAITTINGGTLQIYGAASVSGGAAINGSNGTVEMKGAGPQTIPANLFQANNLKNLIISNTHITLGGGVTLGGTLDIYRSLTWGTGGRTLNTGGFLTIKSTITETAWLGQMISTNFLNGLATVERNIPAHNKAWQFLSTPITAASTQTVKQAWQEGAVTPNANPVPGYGTQLSSARVDAITQPTPGFDAYTQAGPSIKTYANGGYTALNRTDTAISNPKGYMVLVRGPRNITFLQPFAPTTIMRMKGTLHTPANAPVTINITAPGFVSIGNPYASAINFRQLLITGGVQPDFFYLWDPKLTTMGASGSAYGLGAIQTFSWNTLTSSFDVTPGGGSYTAGNSYIESGQAFFVNSTTSSGSVPFREAAKVSGSYDVNRVGPPAVAKQLRTNLNVIISGEPLLLDGNLVQFGHHMKDVVDDNDGLKFKNSGENIAMNRDGKLLSVERRSLIQHNDTIFYNLGLLRVQQYEFEFIPTDLQQPGLHAWLEDNYLHTSTPVSLQDTSRISFNVINEPGSYAPDRFRLVFKQKKKQETTPGVPERINTKLQPAITTKKIVAYPNPVTDGNLQLQFTGQPAGNYELRLLNKLGQPVYNSSILINSNNEVKSIALPGIAAGSYQLSVVGGDGGKTNLQVIIQ
ncbi:MAG: hypothetical protein ABIO04_07980 [Ferruginibacter sp.]